MFLKLFRGSQGLQVAKKQLHTQMCLMSLFDQRRKVENEWKKVENEWKKNPVKQIEWNDDEDEQRRVFHEEERRRVRQQFKCEITDKPKNQGDCECKGMCSAKQSETYLIHYEGGVGTVPKK